MMPSNRELSKYRCVAATSCSKGVWGAASASMMAINSQYGAPSAGTGESVGRLAPWRERVRRLAKGRPQLREVAQQNRGHAVLNNPSVAGRAVHLLVEIVGEKPVAVEPPRCHQNEDAKRGVTEAEAFWLLFGEHADDGVDVFDVAVQLAKGVLHRCVVGQVGEVVHRFEV